MNESGLKFAPVAALGAPNKDAHGKGPAIRFGLAAIKNVGSGAMEMAVAERVENGCFASLEDFCTRLDSRAVNRKLVESLVKCGAFDSFDENRAAVFACIDDAMSSAASTQRDRASGQVSMFDVFETPQRDA